MILLDTHVVIWLAGVPTKLSRKARAAILQGRAGDGIGIAAVSLWELAWLAQNGRVRFAGTIDSFVRECTTKLVVFPITAEIAVRAAQFPVDFPKDPQDRLIGATALVSGIPLVTADEKIRTSKAISTIW